VVLRGLLARALTETPKPSHRRPARAWIAAEAEARRTGGPVPAFQPGLRRRAEQPRVVIGMDASGSIDDTRLALFMAEVTGIARRVGAEVHLIQFDEAVQTQVRLVPHGWQAQLAALPLARGGGTDFGPALAAALTLNPSAIVVLTDLDGPFGPAPRNVPVIWAVPAALDPPVPPFGRVLSLLR
jgi:predicted metal-dependent peptidase